MVWWRSMVGGQGTAGEWYNNRYSQTATSSTLTTPTIWWSHTGTSTPTFTTSTWSSASTATTSIYNEQQRRMQMFEQPAPRREERQIMAAPAILRAREAPVAQRARELLLSFLSEEQRRTYEGHGWFIVVGGRSGRRYRINGGTYAGNVDLLAANDNNKVEARFCGHCDASIPLGDQLLAQKVMLEVDEPAYIALANRRAA